MKNNNRPQKLTNSQMRKGLRKSGYHIYRFFIVANIMAFILSRRNMEVYWVFAEPLGFMVMNWDDAFKINKAREKNNITKLRVRDLNRIAVFRTPKKTWGIIKKAK